MLLYCPARSAAALCVRASMIQVGDSSLLQLLLSFTTLRLARRHADRPMPRAWGVGRNIDSCRNWLRHCACARQCYRLVTCFSVSASFDFVLVLHSGWDAMLTGTCGV
jgi:hypothetical protein